MDKEKERSSSFERNKKLKQISYIQASIIILTLFLAFEEYREKEDKFLYFISETIGAALDEPAKSKFNVLLGVSFDHGTEVNLISDTVELAPIHKPRELSKLEATAHALTYWSRDQPSLAQRSWARFELESSSLPGKVYATIFLPPPMYDSPFFTLGPSTGEIDDKCSDELIPIALSKRINIIESEIIKSFPIRPSVLINPINQQKKPEIIRPERIPYFPIRAGFNVTWQPFAERTALLPSPTKYLTNDTSREKSNKPAFENRSVNIRFFDWTIESQYSNYQNLDTNLPCEEQITLKATSSTGVFLSAHSASDLRARSHMKFSDPTHSQLGLQLLSEKKSNIRAPVANSNLGYSNSILAFSVISLVLGLNFGRLARFNLLAGVAPLSKIHKNTSGSVTKLDRLVVLFLESNARMVVYITGALATLITPLIYIVSNFFSTVYPLSLLCGEGFCTLAVLEKLGEAFLSHSLQDFFGLLIVIIGMVLSVNNMALLMNPYFSELKKQKSQWQL
ncbi:hypothetical protein BSY238_549 [Methyloversatilis sp. RAC08]|uniref:hypothetical protein n=1 Tax=Methyloversatilis sp. RAC08 TaxID=1842540 RepID=UPI0008563737|nr:hypothetical protein [Methyloversatilis sp. RAC08]AOF82725.1 hypothetical protein BSY238_549 [Methyloversatilis sp. RAC08]